MKHYLKDYLKHNRADLAWFALILANAPFQYANLWYWGFAVLFIINSFGRYLYRAAAESWEATAGEWKTLADMWRDMYFKRTTLCRQWRDLYHKSRRLLDPEGM